MILVMCIRCSWLQFQEMNDAKKLEIRKALLMYCELNTLAMVMRYEFFSESVNYVPRYETCHPDFNIFLTFVL